MNSIEKEIKYLLNSHQELIEAIQQTNKGIQEMNIATRELISALLGSKNFEKK